MKRSKFSLSHYKLLSCDMGELVPIAWFEALPGDSIQQATSCLVRLSPLVAPMMHPVHVRVHHWFVPNRLLWDDWEKFITGGADGMDASVPPFRNLMAGAGVGTLHDYIGVPRVVTSGVDVSMLPYRAYSMIWNEWYRDQDLQTEVLINKSSGEDRTGNTTLQNVCWEKDYFTTSRPWPQKGDAVGVPMSGFSPIQDISGQTVQTAAGVIGATTARGLTDTVSGDLGASQPLFANLAGGITPAEISIDDLRRSFALQRYAEARARYGSRYTEYLRYLGIRSSDARLQRPEYLGGGKQVLQVSEVLQTGVTRDGDDTKGVGNLKGHGIGAMRSRRYRRFFEEHGIVLSLLSVKPTTMYTQGLSRQFSRTVREDYFQRELQHIGQQEVLNKEIYAAHATPLGVFGYQDRYDEYRRCESGVSGEFRDTALDFWHMARIFGSTPALNADFVKSVPTKRVHAVSTNDVLWIMANHSIQARRMLSSRGTPSSF